MTRAQKAAAEAFFRTVSHYCTSTSTHRSTLYREAGASEHIMRHMHEQKRLTNQEAVEAVLSAISLNPNGFQTIHATRQDGDFALAAEMGSAALRDACLRDGLRRLHDCGMGIDNFLRAVKEYGVTV